MSGRVFHAPFIAGSPYFKLHAVVERSQKLAQLDYPEVLSYDTVRALLEDPAIELVIVNTPNDTHVELAKEALLAGKHVLVEKPFAPTVAEAQELYDLARRVGKYVLPYHNRRLDSDYAVLKQVVEQNLCGQAIEVQLRFDRYKAAIGPKVFKETPRPAAGILYDLGSHLLDQAIALFGIPAQSIKMTSINRKDSQVDDFASLVLQYETGLLVTITVSMLVAQPQYAFMLNGRTGSFVKARADLQEDQLQAGMSPYDPRYGIESEEQLGELTRINEQQQVIRELLPAPKGDYTQLFDALYAQIRFDQPYFIREEQIIAQLQILNQIGWH